MEELWRRPFYLHALTDLSPIRFCGHAEWWRWLVASGGLDVTVVESKGLGALVEGPIRR